MSEQNGTTVDELGVEWMPNGVPVMGWPDWMEFMAARHPRNREQEPEQPTKQPTKAPRLVAVPDPDDAHVGLVIHPGSSGRDLTPYASSAVASELAKLHALPRPWHEGARWDSTCFEVACNLIELGNAPWSGLSVSELESAFYQAAPRDHIWSSREHRAKWDSARQKVGATAREMPADALAAPRVDEVSAEELTGAQNGSGAPVSDAEALARAVRLTAADSIRPKPVRWLWDERLPLGELVLIAGREGVGKSTRAYQLAADVSRGGLPGEFEGKPRGVLIAATEDSWEHTIVPRLMAAGADLSRVYRVEVETATGVHLGLSLPRDIPDLERLSVEYEIGLMLLDPLMSRLGKLDTHKDAETRMALEPLVSLAHSAKLTIIGLIHHNKSGSDDPLSLIMGSKAFTAVARAVFTVMADPDDETERRRLFGIAKSNLGRTDLPVEVFEIEPAEIPTDEGPAQTSRIRPIEEVYAGSLRDAIRATGEDREKWTATRELSEWLIDYLKSKGGTVLSAEATADLKAAGHSAAGSTLTNARKRAGILAYKSSDGPWFWTTDDRGKR